MKSMLNKVIQIKTNLRTVLIVCAVLAVVVILYLTNGVQNLMLATIFPGQVDTVTVYEQSGERSATLSETDVAALCPLLRNVRMNGRSVRLSAADSLNPYYTVRLKSGIQLTIACYGDHYIINGRGYAAENAQHKNYGAIVKLYEEHRVNREYFPRESRIGG